MQAIDSAPGGPGIEPRWTSSNKSGVGTAATAASRVWFTISHGILNEVYYPEIDAAAIRDFGLLITGPHKFLSEEKRDAHHRIEMPYPGVPAYRITNECNEDRYRLTKTVITDPDRDVVLQKIHFEALKGDMEDYRLYALVAPHLNNGGWHNTCWHGAYKGTPMLFASQKNITMALACSAGFSRMSCGYVGINDGWQDLKQHRTMVWNYARAIDGNVAVTGEIDPSSCNGQFVLALGFGRNQQQAGQQTVAALLESFEASENAYVGGWQAFQNRCNDYRCAPCNGLDIYRISTSVLKIHESKQFSGAMIASLSIPWGNTRSDRDLGGYHLVWPRDLVESASALLASGNIASAHQTLLYLMSTQEADGHWPQNMWLNGGGYWHGVQTDETAFFVLLADALRRCQGLNPVDPYRAITRACRFLVRKGPATDQDRWEENAGYSCFTLAVEIAALLAAADFADRHGDKADARYLRETADNWNALVEDLTYAHSTVLAKEVGVDGHYVRIAPPDFLPGDDLARATISIPNVTTADRIQPAAEVVSPDALALVRFGLRAPDDPRIRNTVMVIDAVLKTHTATGPAWHRYNGDGYGEHADGSPFDGTGIGRAWPLLAGERAHYELAAGNREAAEELLGVMSAQSSDGGLLPEQIWDAQNISGFELLNGRPSGSAMPLVWAHSECIKLVRSLTDSRVFDMPPQTVSRYLDKPMPAGIPFWRFDFQRTKIRPGKVLRLELLAPALVRWSSDDWTTIQNVDTNASGLGVYFTDLPIDALGCGAHVRFTFLWHDSGNWEGRNFAVLVDAPRTT